MKKKTTNNSTASSRTEQDQGQIPPHPAPAAKKKAPQKTTAAKAPPSAVAIDIDYPLEGEIITSPSYSFRVTTDGPGPVEVSLQGKEWFACRESVGHWWFDWSDFSSGPCSMVARVKKKGRGGYAFSAPRQFTVLI